MKCDIIHLKVKKGVNFQMANIEYIIARFWDEQDQTTKYVVYTMDVLEWLKSDPDVLDIIDYQTGELLYEKG